MGKLTQAQRVLLDQLKAGYRIADGVHGLQLKDANGKHVGTVQGKTFAALYRGYLTIQKEGRKRYYVYDPSKDTALGIDTQPAPDEWTPQVGERVRVIGDNLATGEIGVVSDISNHEYAYIVDFPDDQLRFRLEDIEPATRGTLVQKRDGTITGAYMVEGKDAQIAALKAEVEALRAALKPFAELAEEVANTTAFPRDANVVYGYNDHELTVSDFKRAAKALNTPAS